MNIVFYLNYYFFLFRELAEDRIIDEMVCRNNNVIGEGLPTCMKYLECDKTKLYTPVSVLSNVLTNRQMDQNKKMLQ